MRQTTYFCDVCKKMIPSGAHTIEDMDFCSHCWPKVVQAVREYLPPEKIDIGKAQALRDAGWKLADIAKELGTSPTTVHRNTHAPEEKTAKEHEWVEQEVKREKTA